MRSKNAKSKSDVVAINDQKVVDEIVKEVQSKQKKKSKVKENKKGHKKGIAIILIIFLVVALIGGVLFYKYNKDKVILKEKIKLEVGSSIPLSKDYIKKTGNLSNYIEISYKNEKGKKVSLETKTIYLGKDNKEIKEEDALEENKTTLKKDVKSKEVVLSVGNFIVELKDTKSKKVYTSKIQIFDDKAPNLKLRSLEKQEDEDISINDFVEECKDNSRQECQLSFVKEKKDEKTKKVSYEEVELDKSVGDTRDVYIRAKDKSNNVTVEKTTLKVTEKPKETEEENQATGGSSNGSNRGGSSYRGNSRGSNGGNSGGGNSAPAGCGSQGFHTSGGANISQGQMFQFFGCGGYTPSKRQNAMNQINSIFPRLPDIGTCNSRFGDYNCLDWASGEDVYDNATGQVVGIYSPFVMTHCPNDSTGYGCPEVGRGYLTSGGRVVYSWKQY